MADPHGSPTPHADLEEDALRSPAWLPLLGLGLLLTGALAVYLWITPGVANTPAADAATTTETDAAAAPTAPSGNAVP